MFGLCIDYWVYEKSRKNQEAIVTDIWKPIFFFASAPHNSEHLVITKNLQCSHTKYKREVTPIILQCSRTKYKREVTPIRLQCSHANYKREVTPIFNSSYLPFIFCVTALQSNSSYLPFIVCTFVLQSNWNYLPFIFCGTLLQSNWSCLPFIICMTALQSNWSYLPFIFCATALQSNWSCLPFIFCVTALQILGYHEVFRIMRSWGEEKYWFSDINNDCFLILSGFFIRSIVNTQAKHKTSPQLLIILNTSW
jgi:hypothetical protein